MRKTTKSEITPAEVKRRIKGLPKHARAGMVCAMVGHSLIVDGFMGEVTCGRCGAKIADQLLGGFARAKESVRIGHNCATCRKNFKAMDWKHKFMVGNPFGKRA